MASVPCTLTDLVSGVNIGALHRPAGQTTYRRARATTSIAVRFIGYGRHMIVIREALSSDQPALDEMLYQSLYVPPGQQPLSREILQEPDINKYVADWGRPGDLAFIAVDSETDDLLGAAWLRLLKGDEHGYGYVDDNTPELGVAVAAGYRGQGVGSSLLAYLLEAAGVMYGSVSLSVSKGNPARTLYERLGFRLIGEDGDSLTMFKAL